MAGAKKVALKDSKKKKKDKDDNSKEKELPVEKPPLLEHEPPIPIPSDQEFDVDSVVIRSSTKRPITILDPIDISVDNSRLYAVVGQFPLIDLPEDLIYPDFEAMSPKEAIHYLGDIMKRENHNENMTSFWYLDVLSDILRRGQSTGVSNENLKTICIWFDQLIKTISVYGYSRDEFFICFNEMIEESENIYKDTKRIPLPQDIINNIKSKQADSPRGMMFGLVSLVDLITGMQIINSPSFFTNSSKESSSYDVLFTPGNVSTYGIQTNDKSMENRIPHNSEIFDEEYQDCTKYSELAFLTEQFYQIFGNQFKYEVIRTVFSQPPEIIPLTILEKMNFPKDIGITRAQMHEINSQKPQDLQSKSKLKAEQSNNRRKSMKANGESQVERFKREMKELDLERQEELDRMRIKDQFLIPQQDGVDDKYFLKLFPPRKKSLESSLLKPTTKKLNKNIKKEVKKKPKK